MSSFAQIPPSDLCARTARGHGCGLERCGLCEARAVSICDAMEEGQLAELARATTALEFSPGEVFAHEGDAPDHMFNVTAGTVKLFKVLPDGRRQIVGFLTTGDFIGFGRPKAAAFSAEAITSVRACRFERSRFRALLDAHPALERRLLAVASDEIAAAQEHMVLLGRLTAKERVARFLLARARCAHRFGSSDASFQLPMSRGDIADYLGLTTETVSRVFTQMRKNGLIGYTAPTDVVVRDPLALSVLATGD